MDHADVVIVGAGHAGAQCAIALRQNGFSGTVALIGREPDYPYERPPLSKDYFARKKSLDRIYIRPPAFWVEKAIDLRLGTEVAAVNPEARTVTLSGGATLAYGTLVWAAGGNPRGLSCPGADLDGLHAVRTRQDCDALMAQIDAGAKRIVLIGGGYIGLEAAAVMVGMGLEVTLLEAMPRVLSRVAGEELSAFYQGEHRRHGVDLRTGVAVEAIEGAGNRVSAVRLADGQRLAADAVVVGIGVVPAIDPLIKAGADHAAGVLVDRHCRTSLPDIYAIGDCAAFACDYAGGATMRVESVQNANDMAVNVAKAICGDVQPYRVLPWFWSNQYDLRLQTVGISTGFDQTVLRGDVATGSFSVVYLKQGKIIALDCVNKVKDYVQGGKLVEAGHIPDIARLRDEETPLKSV